MPPTLPAWGLITALPHQHLVHLRRGKLLASVQGGSCTKLPGDTVALIDTSVHRLQFTADQVTREKVGVAVTGLAVYRIVAPRIAWRMLDLSDDGKGLAEILRQMFVGATRRLVANLSLEDCLTRRKDALADELMAEIAPVVQGSGRTEDATSGGWGVAIDTIEVQDVRVLSEEVFARLQAPYREELALQALHARATVERAEAERAREVARAQEAARLEQHRLEQGRVEAVRVREAESRQHAAAVARIDLDASLERERIGSEARVQTARLEAEANRVRAEAEAEAVRLRRAAEAEVSEARLRELALTETLPRVAEAFADSFDRITVTGASDLSVLGSAVGQVLATAEAFGVAFPGRKG